MQASRRVVWMRQWRMRLTRQLSVRRRMMPGRVGSAAQTTTRRLLSLVLAKTSVRCPGPGGVTILNSIALSHLGSRFADIATILSSVSAMAGMNSHARHYQPAGHLLSLKLGEWFCVYIDSFVSLWAGISDKGRKAVARAMNVRCSSSRLCPQLI